MYLFIRLSTIIRCRGIIVNKINTGVEMGPNGLYKDEHVLRYLFTLTTLTLYLVFDRCALPFFSH